MVVFDTSTLLLVLDPSAKPPTDPATGQPIAQARRRIEHLIDTLSVANEKIIIPTPVLSEVLVHAGEATDEYLRLINGHAAFRVVPFEAKAALEAALIQRDAITRAGNRVDAAHPDQNKTKIKFDRMIVAIGKAEGARTIYSDDGRLIETAERHGLKAHRTADLDPPPQGELDV